MYDVYTYDVMLVKNNNTLYIIFNIVCACMRVRQLNSFSAAIRRRRRVYHSIPPASSDRSSGFFFYLIMYAPFS